MTDSISREEAQRIAESAAQQAANQAVRKVFAIFGTDVDNPREVEELRRDLRSAGWIRKMSERSMMAAIGAVAVGMVVALFAGIVASINGGK